MTFVRPGHFGDRSAEDFRETLGRRYRDLEGAIRRRFDEEGRKFVGRRGGSRRIPVRRRGVMKRGGVSIRALRPGESGRASWRSRSFRRFAGNTPKPWRVIVGVIGRSSSRRAPMPCVSVLGCVVGVRREGGARGVPSFKREVCQELTRVFRELGVGVCFFRTT